MAYLADKIRKLLSKEICDGVYPPGTRMPTRLDLMRKYGIARATVDKVIGQLIAEGTVISTRGSGTYVVEREPKRVHLYVVLNTEVECAEATEFHARLGLMLANVSGGERYSMLGSGDMESRFSEVIANPASRVIWSRPSIKSYGDIASLQRARTRQILVNRPISEYNFVSTDTRQAIETVFDRICARQANARFGLLAPPIELEESFLAERELYFHEMAHRYGVPVNFMGRTVYKSARDIAELARAAMDAVDRLDYLFVPDFAMVPYLWAVASERSIKLGRDLHFVTIDWNEEPSGVVCVRQDWDTMLGEAVRWAKSAANEPIRKLVPAEVVLPW